MGKNVKKKKSSDGGAKGGGGRVLGKAKDARDQKRSSFLTKVARSGAAAKAAVVKKPKPKSKSGYLGDLSSVLASLEEAGEVEDAARAAKRRRQEEAAARRGKSVKSSRARASVTLEETRRAQAVAAHPAFRKDPLAAIAHHLSQTLPAAPKPRPQVSNAERKRNKRRNKKGVDALLDSIAL